MVFELIVFGIILLAVGYWATMFAMGRRDDVLHGHFVQDEEVAGPPVSQGISRPRLPLPARPAARQVPAGTQPSKDSLQALLTVIKQDLQDAAR